MNQKNSFKIIVNRPYVLLFAIMLIAFLLRVIKLSDIPASLSHDEVAIGYNAWSILKTGSDEYGVKFPLLFRSFDDYKLPGYVYLTAFSEFIFGLTPFAVRFPSAMFGTLSVGVLYFFVKALLLKTHKNDAFKIALLCAAVLALSPWHINFSRAAFESNVSAFFILLSTTFLLKARTNSRYYFRSSISGVLALYTYYSSRVILPIVYMVYIFLYFHDVRRSFRNVIFACILGIILLLPLIPQMLSSGMSRVNQVSIFEDKSLTNPYSEAIVKNGNSIFARSVYNRRVAYAQQFTDNYLKNFAPDFYFTNGTGPMGLLYFWEIPFFLLGIYSVAKLKSKSKWIIFAFYLSVPIVGGLTVQQPNALRTLPNVFITSLFTGIGLYYFGDRVKRKKIVLTLAAFIVALFFIRFLVMYFDYQKINQADKWGDGHSQLASYLRVNQKYYDKIYITGERWRPYTYLLFYTNYDPKLYQNEKGSRYGFGRYKFGRAIWDEPGGIDLSTDDLTQYADRKTLFILSKNDLNNQNELINIQKRPYRLKVIESINGKYNSEIFYVVKIQ